MNSLVVLFACVIAVCSSPQSPPPALGKLVGILKQTNDINPDGSYQYSYEAENGISAEESGKPSNLPEYPIVSVGSYKYTDYDGTPFSVQYVADENGFQPQGAHLPVAPPIPAAIAKALDWIAAHPAPPETK